MKILLLFLLQQSFGLYVDRRKLFKMTPLFLVNSQDEIKICKDCKFFKKDYIFETRFGHCLHFPNEPINNYYLVDGFKYTSPTSYHYCSTARSFDNMCGTEGKYFESK
jgi:hypothetical protein